MKISTLIERLQEAQANFGDLDVMVGETNGVLRSRIGVTVQPDEDDKKICIVQAYVVRDAA